MSLRTASRPALIALLVPFAAAADEPPLAAYFRAETARVAARPLGGIDSAGRWKSERPGLQRRLAEMLGLWPSPGRTDLHAEVRGVVERPDFVVEKLLFQSRPGLYVTANLYRPKAAAGRLPAVLYLCGHGEVKKDGVIYGNKAHYQHHAAWYAAHGYVCLVLDTLQLGEVPGLHHGTYRERMWWWQTRGYTPAGVEAWNAIRAIDYLQSRPEVDPAKIGVTGRSGGGASSWWVGALDDRVAAVAPVAGITDLADHLGANPSKDYPRGVIDGHCDCMYFVNTYRWDFPLLAALVAPKPLLVENTDADPIFPIDGVRRIYGHLETVYGWYGARDRLGLVIGQGGHADTVELRHPSFAFMDRWLKGKATDPATIAEPDRRVPIEDLKVLRPGEVPPGSRNATIHETFVPAAATPPVPKTREEWDRLRARWMEDLRSRVFAGWPTAEEACPLDVKPAGERVVREPGVRVAAYEFTSQPGVRLRLWTMSRAEGAAEGRKARAAVAGEGRRWARFLAMLDGAAPDLGPDPGWPMEVERARIAEGETLLVIAPRGVGPSAWPAKADVTVRRRFALLGQTLDGMRVWDIRRALEAAAATRPAGAGGRPSFALAARGDSAALALWAAIFEPTVEEVVLDEPPTSLRRGPAVLNAGRILDVPQALGVLFPRPVRVVATEPAAWAWPRDLGRALSPDVPWPPLVTPFQ